MIFSCRVSDPQRAVKIRDNEFKQTKCCFLWGKMLRFPDQRQQERGSNSSLPQCFISAPHSFVKLEWRSHRRSCKGKQGDLLTVRICCFWAWSPATETQFWAQHSAKLRTLAYFILAAIFITTYIIFKSSSGAHCVQRSTSCYVTLYVIYWSLWLKWSNTLVISPVKKKKKIKKSSYKSKGLRKDIVSPIAASAWSRALFYSELM